MTVNNEIRSGCVKRTAFRPGSWRPQTRNAEESGYLCADAQLTSVASWPVRKPLVFLGEPIPAPRAKPFGKL